MTDRKRRPGRRVPLADLPRQVAAIRPEVDRRIAALLDTATFVLRDPVETFEREFAEFIGVRHGVGVGNGTDALTLALKALDLRPGDEVVTATNSFIATAEAIVLAGGRPVLVDVDPVTYCLDAQQVAMAVTSRTRAIVPVHLYGRPADLDPIIELAQRHRIPLVEDAAQAHGATWHGRRVGGIGLIGCFSFYPTKNLGAFGDAGIVVTDDDQIAERVRLLRDHGGLVADEHRLVGHNSRLDSLQAAVLSAQLGHLDSWNELRRRHAARYTERLSGIGDGTVIAPPAPCAEHVHHLFVTRVPDGRRDAMLAALRDAGIGAARHYPLPIHQTPAFAFLDHGPGSFPTAERLATEILSLPMFPHLTDDEIEYVCDVVEAVANSNDPSGAA